MKKLLLFALAVFFLAPAAKAQDFITAQLTTASPACSLGTGTDHITLSTVGFGSAVLTLNAGAWTGTVQFWGSGDGGTVWGPLSATPSGGGTAVTSYSGTGSTSQVWQVNTSAYTHICMLQSADSLGNVVAKIHISTLVARSGGGGGSGGMIYPSAGLAQSTGTAWAASITAPAAVLTWLGSPSSTNLGLADGPEASNTFFAAPSGGGPPTFRAINQNDIPATFTVPITNIASAAGGNAIQNMGTGGFISWQWTGSTAGPLFSQGESAGLPSTGGAITNAIDNQSVLQAMTVPGSTASPMWIQQGALTGTLAVPALQIQSTWNNGATTFNGIVESVTNTSSNVASNLISANAGTTGTTNEFYVNANGKVFSNGGFIVNSGPYTGLSANGSVSYLIVQGGGDNTLTSTLGSVIVRGGNNSSNAAGAGSGGAFLQSGYAENATPGSAMFGTSEMIQGYFKGAAIANAEDVVCGTTTQNMVTDCATTPTVNVIGIAAGTANPVGVIVDGQVPVRLDVAMTAIGDIICLSTTTAGLAHDNGTAACATAGAQIGVIVANTGIVPVAPTGNSIAGQTPAPTLVTLSTTLPLVQLHFR